MKMIDHNHFICHLILGTFTEYPQIFVCDFYFLILQYISFSCICILYCSLRCLPEKVRQRIFFQNLGIQISKLALILIKSKL